MRTLRNRQYESDHIREYLHLYSENSESIHSKYEEQQKHRIYQEHFKKLGKDCRKVLTLFFKGYSVKEIADKMRYKNEKYAKRRKYLCKEELVKSIKQDKRFKDLS